MKHDERLYALALEASNVGTWYWNIATNEIRWSDNIENLLGLDKGQFDGQYESFLEILPKDDRQYVVDSLNRSLEFDAPYEIEHRIVWPNGETHWYLEKGKVLRDSQGLAIEMLGTTQDITNRKHTEQALLESESRYRSVISTMSIGVVVHDREHRILSCNPAAEQILGLTHDQLMGRTSFDPRWHAIHENGNPFEAEQHPSVVTMQTGVPQKDVLMGVYKPDDTLSWISINSEPLIEPGESTPYNVVVTFIDITARKRAEEKLQLSEKQLRLAINIAQLGIWDWDIASDRTVWQGKMFDFYGVSPENFTGKGADYIAYTREDYRESQENNIRQAFANSLTEQQLLNEGSDILVNPKELCIVRPDGSEVYTLGDAVAISDSEGKPLRMLGITIDISLRKQAEIQLKKINSELEQRVQQRTAQLEEANMELESFSYSISHDLRAPLRTINGFAQILYEDYHDKFDNDALDFLDRMRHGAKRMGLLIDDLLSLSRVGQATLSKSHVDLSNMVHDILDQLMASVPERKITYRIESDIIATGDKQLLNIALTNLLENALKYTSKKQNAIIEFGRDEQKNRTVYFIRDNGSGFDMQYADKLFGAFQRLHSDSDFPGTGIGLATVARIIRRHDGKIWAESIINEGATFYFSL